jgi:hypothetical protein
VPKIRTIKTSFVGGEISPELFGRLDLPKEQEGLAACHNCWILPHGPAQNRPGFKYVNTTKLLGKKSRLIPFIFSNDQAFAMEFGDKYIRFHSYAATLKENLVNNGGFLTGTGGWQVFETSVWAKGRLTVSGGDHYPIYLLGGHFFTLAGWTIATTGAGSSVTRVLTGEFTGKAKLVQAANGNAARLSRSIVTIPGVDYVLECVVDGLPCGIGIGSSSTVYDNYSGIAPVGKFLHVFTATLTSTVITFYGRTTKGTCYVSGARVRDTWGYLYQNFATNPGEIHTLTVDVDKPVYCGLYNAATDTDVTGSNYAVFTLTAGVNTLVFTSSGTPYTRMGFLNIDKNDYEYTIESVFCNSENNTALFHVDTLYLESDLDGIKYTQSGDIVTLVHPKYPPQELKRYDNATWTITTIEFNSKTPAPTGQLAVATGAGSKEFKYVITALNAQGYEESMPSAETAVVTNALTTTGNWNTITWSAVTGAVRYNIYKYSNGTFGYIGQTTLLTFRDDNIVADLTRTLPLRDDYFVNVNDYPSAVGYYEQRRWFAGTNNEPQNLWGTQSGTESNMNYSVPSRDSDALRFRVASQRASQVRHIVALIDMVLLTASAEYRVFATQGGALTASTLNIKPQSGNGCSAVPPVIVNNAAVFVQQQGNHLRELAYQWQANGYQSKDLSLLATHLFDGDTIVDMAFARTPQQTIWVVTGTGKLLGLTYLPDQEVAAWHQHTTDGYFESICVVTEGVRDVLYAIVRRTISGVVQRYVETLVDRGYTTLADAFFVDSGLTYSGIAVGTVTGLDHLEGKTVSVLADGKVQPQKIVVGGAITLTTAASTVQVGLPIDAYIETVPMSVAGDASLGYGHIKNIMRIWARFTDFVGAQAGPTATRLVPIRPLKYEVDGVTPKLANGEAQAIVVSNWNQDGGLIIKQPDPLPLTVVGVAMEVATGD